MMLKEMLEFLLELPQTFWNLYALQNDSSCQKLSRSQRHHFAQGARQEAVQVAQRQKNLHAQRTVSEILAIHGVMVAEMPPTQWGSKIPFAIYEEPSLIYINRQNTQSCQYWLEQSGFIFLLKGHSVEEILLAHELYHVLASKGDAPFARKRHALLWKLGRFESRSRIPALEEVGAMAFAQEFLDLAFCPFILDLPLTYCHSPELAQSLYNRIITLWQTLEGEST